MKGFIILLITISATTLAAPQYNYAQPGGHGGGFNNIGSGGGGGGSGPAGSGFIGGPGGFQNGDGIGVNGGGFSGANGGYAQGAVEQQAIVTKQFFIHSAPEEPEERGADKIISLGPQRKHYRVVFIKAPHNSVQAGRIRLIAPANEEKTAIYVLSKKTDAADIQADVQQAHSEPAKPEVHFIKYKTHEEAAHAQRTIQAQYDAIQGTSQISDEGIAPISSVIGILGGDHQGAGHTSGGGGGFASGSGGSGSGAGFNGNINPSYLPPSY